MNKEEIEKAKEEAYWKGYVQKQKEAGEICKMCKYRKKYKELEQKESILDKVTDKLKEDRLIFNYLVKEKSNVIVNKSLFNHANEILNIIEGEKK